MATIEFRNVRKEYPRGILALEDFSLVVQDRELLAILGPSGCGKTTALRLTAGLESVTAGEILFDGKPIHRTPPHRRNVAMVFQDHALYPHKTVRGNLEFPLRMRKLPRDQISERVRRVARLLELGDLLDRKPGQLSGGQQQRVAMGRAIVRDPAVFLMDEPLSDLDADLRARIRAEIAELQRRTGVTTIYVTHDQAEAMTLGKRVAVLQDGRIQQVGPPTDVYRHPANVFVARFIGNPGMNILPGVLVRAKEGTLQIEFGECAFPISPQRLRDLPRLAEFLGQRLFVGIRPEAFQLARRFPELPALHAAVRGVETFGHDQVVYFALPNTVRDTQSPPALAARMPANHRYRAGDEIALAVEPDHWHFFDPRGNAI